MLNLYAEVGGLIGSVTGSVLTVSQYVSILISDMQQINNKEANHR